MASLFSGIFPKHQFALIGEVDDVDIVVHRDSFQIPEFAQGVFEELLSKRVTGKINRGENNIIHVDSLVLDSNNRLTVVSHRCDYAAYLALCLSASEQLLKGDTLLRRYGRKLHETWHTAAFRYVSFPPLGCTLGLTGICTSSDGFLITKKKPNKDSGTATDHGKRLHLGASQIRYDYPAHCFTARGMPNATEQMKELIGTKEGTPEILEKAVIAPLAVGIFLKDHHPELFFDVAVHMTAAEIMEHLKKVDRPEGEFEAIDLNDDQKIRRILSGYDEFPFADHHAGGLISWIWSSQVYGIYREFMPSVPLPPSFS